MFRYLTTYRFYTLAKLGLGLAYLWFILDFFWIHVAYWNGLSSLLPDPSEAFSSSNSMLDQQDNFFVGRISVWFFFVASPLAVGLYLWGRHHWLQFAVGGWINLRMIAMVYRTNSGYFLQAALGFGQPFLYRELLSWCSDRSFPAN
jgi:hypothetical protein